MSRLFALCVLLFLVNVSAWAAPPTSPGRLEGFVEVNGVRLQYLDWGGSGQDLILIHGLADNPHVFDDLVPGLIDRFHVIGYSRRGSGSSDVKGPYDIGTLTEDLRGLMDALRIEKADLVGFSAGGDEITEMAVRHPERVGRIVYFDGAYLWADPDFKEAVKALPAGFFDPPPSAMVSFDAFRLYQKSTTYPGLDDVRRIDANLLDKVVIQRDGSVRNRTPREVVSELYSALWANTPRKYAEVHTPALAIYAEHLYDLHIPNGQRRDALIAYERNYWQPFQQKSMEYIRRQMQNVQIVRLPGAHPSFHLTNRQKVIDLVRGFLDTPAPSVAQRVARQP
jgi:pimeloyl-ACP methyl ester carboxylesterase